ncbi:hypothetical protein [Capnocytophaga ochracea]|nr:hypothetical protein [Capnocytophaga ochracea]UAK51053.1 hypothetical protein K8O87_09910 [Capnocytophaga ochracea]
MGEKHRILKILNKEYNDKSYSGTNYTEEGKSLSEQDLHRKTNIHLDKLNLILSSLKSYDYIKSTKLCDGKNLTYYYITDKGRDALLERRFIWYLSSSNWAFIISIFSLIIAFLQLFFPR